MNPWAVPSTALMVDPICWPVLPGGNSPGDTVCSWSRGSPISTSTMIEMPTTVASTRYQARTVLHASEVLRWRGSPRLGTSGPTYTANPPKNHHSNA